MGFLYFRRLGISTDVLLVVFPEDENFRRSVFAYGPMERPGKLTHDYGTTFRADIQVRERI